ncbi:MAG: hypothetical protein K2H32_08900 [Muribaculaceae bacterium]|nr:hypothetical protein [Muribaculaceae bacterium]
MKKAAFFSLLALCLGFVSCDNYEEPNPPAQSNPQESIFEVNGLTVEPHLGILDLDAINLQGADVPVASVKMSEFPEGYQLQLEMEVSGDDTFEKSEIMSTNITSDSVVTVTPDALQAVINNLITKDPSPLKVLARFAAYAVNGKTKVRLGDPEVFYCTETLDLVPLTPAVLLEETYYFVYSKDGKDWSKNDTVRMTRAGAGSLYDDPVFSFTYDFTKEMIGDGLYWKIVAESVLLSNGFPNGEMFGPAADEKNEQNGVLLASSTGGILTMDGVVMMTANMFDRTFEYIQAIASFYTPGNANGWSFPYPVLFSDDFVHYSGFVSLEGSFKFAPEAGWGRDFGQVNNADDAIGYSDVNGQIIGKGVANGGDNIPVGVDGLNYVTLNYLTRETVITAISTVGLIGDFNGWGGDLEMTPNEDFTEWTAEVKFENDGGWKIRMNNDWAINLGGDVQNLTMGGDNISATKGTYNVKLILKGQPYAVEVTAK